MKVIKSADRVVAYRHWYKWYFSDFYKFEFRRFKK